MFNCVAVVNDQTGHFQYILDGYQGRFPGRVPVYAKKITSIKQYGENEVFRVETCDGFIHLLSTEKYSFIYEESINNEDN